MKNCRAFIFVLLAFLAAACKEDPKDDQPADSFDRKALFTNLSETAILPAFLDFVKQADSLQQIAEAFRLQPDLPNLSALRDQWIQTKFASKQIELLKFGPLNDTKMYSLVDKWPTNEGFIEGFINGSDPITESFIQGKGATSKGLPAIEYLLFEEKDADLLLARLKNEPRRVDYIVAASHNLYQKTLEIASLWSPLGDNYQAEYIENTFSGLDGSLSLTVNQMSSHLEFMLVSKLGKALGKDLNRDADPVYLEAYRSGVSA
ncbi:MAG TPA: hypothetical protein DDW81_04090, partial [Cryomorphaceae bacterium]|nr:hypothetical protein [Cryomorphaceae bacterium]